MSHAPQHSSSWVNFTYIAFGIGILMTGGGIFFLDTSLWPKGFLAMGVVMVIMTSIILTKTIRDVQDFERESKGPIRQ